ncbi:hypothetical protein B0H17DRAFT_1207356 [Mycena rosella]|uniref:Uncharacterized protein n=1 Tax=Mycena rosella TaxID=1033263 RepID=A0AAD7GBY0_MYCRO|nr:hypothetical protein B0H17DRAFT_1207356 [Mycena rosella]
MARTTNSTTTPSTTSRATRSATATAKNTPTGTNARLPAASTPIRPTSIALDAQPETPAGAYAAAMAARTAPSSSATTAAPVSNAPRRPARRPPQTSSAAATPASSADDLGRGPHEDPDVASPHEHPLGTTDLALSKVSDSRARDDVRSPEPHSPLPDALVRMVVQAADKLAASHQTTDTGEAQAAAAIAAAFRAEKSDATAFRIDEDDHAADGAANGSAITAVRCFFHNIDQEYLSPEDIQAAVSLAAARRSQKGKGREEPPAHEAGRSAFLSPIAQEMEEGEVDEDMPLVDPQLGDFFDPSAARPDPHLDAEMERAIAENVLANRALPEFDPSQIACAKANSLGLDPGPASQDASSSRLADDPPAAARRPDGSSGVSPSPPKKPRYAVLEPIDTSSPRVTRASAAAAQRPPPCYAAAAAAPPFIPPTTLTLPNTSLTGPFTHVPRRAPAGPGANPLVFVSIPNAAATAAYFAAPPTVPATAPPTAPIAASAAAPATMPAAAPLAPTLTVPLAAPGPAPPIAPAAAPPPQVFTGHGINPALGVFRTLDGRAPRLYYTQPPPGGWEETTGMAPATALDNVMQAQRDIWTAGIGTNPAAFLRRIGGTTDLIGDAALLAEGVTKFTNAPPGVVQVAVGAPVPGQVELPNIFLLTGLPADATTALVEERVVSAGRDLTFPNTAAGTVEARTAIHAAICADEPFAQLLMSRRDALAPDLPARQALADILASVRVSPIELLHGEGTRVAWRVYLTSPTNNVPHHNAIRNGFARITFMTFFSVGLVRADILCRLCTSVDHPAAICPLLVPGWMGTTPTTLPALPVNTAPGRGRGRGNGRARGRGRGTGRGRGFRGS